jgi:signal transduction histidine kinase
LLEAYAAHALLDAQGEILEQMADGATLRETLPRIAALIEKLAPSSLCTIALLQPDGRHLKSAAAPSLPEAFRAVLNAIEISPCCGSCGTAAWRKEPVIVTDIASDPLWQDMRTFALSFGLRACWSFPILHNGGSVLGTIALYYREPRAPAENDLGLLASCTTLIHLALTEDRKENELRASEAREKDLRDTKAAAEAANRAKSKFLAGMSHELRTPLNAIIGFSDMIRNKVFGPITPPRYEAYIDDIYKSGMHLLSLINDVLDMAKIEAQKFELRRAPAYIARVADRALLLVRPQAQSKNVKLVIDLPAGVCLFVDERAICQVLVNLLANAVKFTNPDGTVRLFGERLPSGGMTLGVADTGTGMTPEGIETALQPFGQPHMEISTERSGTGLGLPIAKALLEGHGAEFHITSALGVGTRVWGEFPAKDVSEDLAAGPSGIDAPPGRDARERAS